MKFASLISLGCAKNLIDSEIMVGQLVELGYRMTDALSEAKLILINTCGFLESAVQEAINTILETSRYKEDGKCEQLVVAGCVVQRYGKKLPALLPEVDLFLGTSHYHQLAYILEANRSGNSRKLWIARPLHSDTRVDRVRSTGTHSAYLKIAEGCDNTCSFCIIPNLRGPLRSRAEADIVAEARNLAAEGVKEINLVAQDTTAYGLDRGDPLALPRLLTALEKISGLEWVRLLYVYPDRITDRLLQILAGSGKIVPYLDIPIQHCVPGILENMGRPVVDPERIVERIRLAVPGIALRTSIMVGFPGETDSDFKKLVSFMRRVKFDHAGVFAFSPEIGTKAAKLHGRPDRELAEGRRSELLEIQRQISRSKLRTHLGRVVDALIEGPHPETDLLLSARLPTQAPEVDGNVIITGGTCEIGTIRKVKITATHDYDLEGILVE